jgi:hypothetical protein
MRENQASVQPSAIGCQRKAEYTPFIDEFGIAFYAFFSDFFAESWPLIAVIFSSSRETTVTNMLK